MTSGSFHGPLSPVQRTENGYIRIDSYGHPKRADPEPTFRLTPGRYSSDDWRFGTINAYGLALTSPSDVWAASILGI
jgi:hypothetical protein